MKTEIRERILDTSLELFNERGYHRVTTNHIAEAMGKSPATIYYHFGNKETIVRALLPRIEAEWQGNGLTGSELRTPATGFAGMLGVMQRYMDTVWRYRFFSINAVYLKAQDEELAHMHERLRHGGRLLIHALLLGIRATDAVNEDARLYSKAEDEAFVTNIELILDNWARHLQLNEAGDITREKLDRGILQVLAMILPWLAADWQATVRDWLQQGSLPEGVGAADQPSAAHRSA